MKKKKKNNVRVANNMNMDTLNYKQKIEEACPKGKITVWGDHGFIYEEKEEKKDWYENDNGSDPR